MPTYTTTGTGDAYVLSVPGTIVTKGVPFQVKFHTPSLSIPTLQYNTADPLYLYNSQGNHILPGEIQTDDVYFVVLDGISFFCLNYLTGGDKQNGNYTKIESDGTVVAEGDATTHEDDNLDPTMLTGGGALPTQINFASTTTRIAAFSATSIDEVAGNREIPHAWKFGTPISFHAHTYPTTTNVGVVRLGLEYFFSQEGVAVTTSTTIYVEHTTSGVARAKHSVSFADITPPSQLGSQFHFRFFREGNHANDTYTGDLAISTIGYHFEKDMNGSRQRLVK